MWRYYVHESFREKKSPVDKRRRELALGLSNQSQPVPHPKLPEVSVQTIEAYHGKGRMTLARDVAELIKMKLIVKVSNGYLANKDTVLAFLPDRASLGRPPIPNEQTTA